MHSGLETYTLRSGYHTVREAQLIDDVTNTCPPNSTPICLIGWLFISYELFSNVLEYLQSEKKKRNGSKRVENWQKCDIFPQNLLIFCQPFFKP